MKPVRKQPRTTKSLLFSVGIEDCRVDTFRAGGSGGQNQNKVESGVRIVHLASGAVGEARDSRDQLHNKRNAFKRMAEKSEFKAWHKKETARRLGQPSVDDLVDRMMSPENLQVEMFNGQSWQKEEHETSQRTV